MSYNITDKGNGVPASQPVNVAGRNITINDLPDNTCGCHFKDLTPSELDKVIAQYEAMKQEAQRAKDALINAALALEDIAHETNATNNKNEILAALSPYIVSNLTTDLEPFTKAGEYHIVFKRQLRPDRPDTIEIPFILLVQVSPNGDIIQARLTTAGYIYRVKAYDSESWGEWSEQYNYASKADIEEAKQWAAIGWVL